MTRLIAAPLLKKAIEDDRFDRTIGKGSILQLLDSPNTDPAWRVSFHVLKNAGMRPSWLELDLEIRHE